MNLQMFDVFNLQNILPKLIKYEILFTNEKEKI